MMSSALPNRTGQTFSSLVLLLPLIWPAVADAQTLFRFERSAPDEQPRGSPTAVEAGATARRPTPRKHSISVRPELLRTAPRLLELPTPGDGPALLAERTAFEDRGEGNVSWAGRLIGATHETVVLTLQDGWLIGSYGEPGQFKFEVAAENETGFVTEPDAVNAVGSTEPRDWCDARPPPSPSLTPTNPAPITNAAVTQALPRQTTVTAPQTSTTTHRFDVLVLYTQDASNYWTTSDAAAVQAAIDYTNSVWRNGSFDATLHLAHAAPAPARYSTEARRGRDWLDPISEIAEIKLLRETHEADAVLIFIHDGSSWARCGAAYLRLGDHRPQDISPWALGFADLACHSSSRSGNSIFAHELGHILGGNHDPEGGGTAEPEDAVYPYAFGHTDTAPDPDIATIMSYGTHNYVREAYFSTVRITPNNWNIGVANQRENERALQQTVGSATEMSDYLPPAPPSGLTGTAAPAGSGASVSLTWRDNSSIEETFEVQYRTWLESWETDTKVGATLAANTNSATLTGLAAATRYAFRVVAKNTHGSNESDVWSVRTPGDGPPTAPGDLAAVALDSNSVRLTWTDNALVEAGYDVQYGTDGQSWTTRQLATDTETDTITGLTAATSWMFRVGARNAHGTAFADAVTVSTLVPAAPTGLVAAASGTTGVALTWQDNSSDETGFLIQYRIDGAPGWTDYPTEPSPDTTSATITGLTAGADYEFRVFARNGAALSQPSNVASLGGLGAPTAASGLTATGANSESVDLSWTDNSSDEAGFDVEYRTGGGAWTTVATTEPDWTSWSVGNLSPSTNYDFRVLARNAAGSAASNVVTRRTGPAAPSHLRAERTAGQWRLHWQDNSDDEVEFDVYYQTASDEWDDTWGYLKSPARNSTSTDTALTGQNYFFVMYAFIDSARTSSPGNVVAVGALSRPAIPQEVAAFADGSTAANVNWRDNSANEGGFRLQHRRLVAGESPGAWTSTVVGADTASTTVTGLVASATYEFRVTSFFQPTDTAEASLSRSSTFTTRMPPAAPTGLSAQVQSTSAELAWTDNAAHETGFKVEYRERGTSAWTLSSSPSSDTASATVTGLTTGTDYEFRVIATNANGDSTPSNVVSTAPAAPPAAPSGVTVLPTGSTSVTVSWSDNSSDETGFDVEHRMGSNAWITMVAAANATTAAVTGLMASASYEFRVSARNLHGSAPSSAVSLTMPPAAPSGLLATPASSTSVSLSWTDESTDETSFAVQYRASTGTTWITFGAEAAADAESGTVTGLTAGTSYDFRVLAKHSSNGLSSPSNVAAATTPAPPTAVSGLTTTSVNSTSVGLSWTDNSSDEAGFDVEYRTGGSAWATASTTEPDWTTWLVGNLTPSTDYDFRVVARNANGATASGVAARKTGPEAPSNLAASSSGGTWRLAWRDNSNDEAEFDVYYQTATDEWNGTWTYLKSPPRNSTSTDTELTGQNYFFTLFAYVSSTRSSSPSNIATVGALPRPAIPQEVVAVGAGSTSADVSWRDNSANEGGFRVEYRRLSAGQSPGSWTASVVAADASSATVTGLTASGTYEFRVTSFLQATDTAEASLSRSSTFIMRMPPARPTSLQVLRQSTTADLAWTDNASHETGFRVEYRERGTSAWTLSSTALTDATSATVSGLAMGVDYDFQVIAFNANGDSTPSNVGLGDVIDTLTIGGLSNATVAENAAWTGPTPTVTGHRGAVTWTKSGTDAADFGIVSTTGVLSMVARDHENPVDDDPDNVYEVTVTATDEDNVTGSVSITLTVTNVNEPPAFASASTLALSVAEGTTGNIGSPVTATDPEGTALTYSLSGTDASAFQVSSTGQISLAAGTVLNHEQKASYSFNVVASEPGQNPLTATRAVTLTVTDVAETITISDLANATVAENAAWTSPTPTTTGHRGAVTWTKSGTDASDFAIVSTTGVLSMVARDHEDPVDDDPDNVYEVTVTATDEDSITGSVSITLTVTNVNEAPTFATATTLALSVPEGTTGNIGLPVTGTDPEGASLTYSLSGTDASAFQISSTGQISLAAGTVLNHEQKANYSFNVVASEPGQTPLTATRAVTLTVTDVAETITISGLANATVAENAAWTGPTPTTTGHRGAVTWTKSGTDAADFAIISTTGVLSMVARDHEDAADDDEDNVYEVTVTATDEDNITGSVAITVTVTNVNEAPTFATATTLALSVAEGTTGNIGSPVTATDPEGAAITYSLSGTDASAFQISSTGQVSLAAGTVLNHEQKASYSFNVVASEPGQNPLTATRAVTLTVTDVAETITISGLANATVAENAAWTGSTPTTTGHRGAVTWTKSGADAADFAIVSTTGVLSMVARDHEDPVDDDPDNVYEVTVTATDEDSITGSVSITLTVTNVNEAPTFATATTLSLSVAEGTTGNIGSPVTATDPDGATLAYSLSGADASAFRISSNGQISLAAGTVLNHEQKASYSFNVVASEPGQNPLTATRAVTLTVTDVAETITISGLANATVAENAAWTGPTPTTTGHRGAVTWTKSGTDASDFAIVSTTGVLSMVARDHEDPADDDPDNVYEVTVTATDEDNITGSVAITVTVTNVNEAPVFASATTLALSEPEGTTGNIGSPVTATDPEGAAITYSLSGTDASAFQISSTGQVSLAAGTVLNHEQKASYSFNVVASEPGQNPLTATRAVTLTVTDVAETITISGLANATVAENAAWTGPTPSTTGHRGTVTWTKSGTDAADFGIVSATGVLSMIARDYENPADDDPDNVYEVTVTATDEDNITGSVAITVTVTNVNEAPTFATATTLSLSVAEGTTGNIGSPVTATDPDGATLAYSLSGADASAFRISSNGQISLAAGTVLNHEQKASYSFNVVASEPGQNPLTATRAVTLTVTDVAETITISGLANATVAENAAWTSPTPTVTGHRGTVTWTKSGTDAADFGMVSATGVLSMIARDHENPADDDQDNVYEVTVTATDEDSITGSVSMTLTVTNVNEPPTFASATTLALSAPEGTTGNIGSPVTATDPEGAALTYSLSGADASAFQVSSTGQISLAAGTVLNHEQKASYGFNVVASEPGQNPLAAARAVTLTVTDVAEAITVSGLANATVAENAAWTGPTPTTTGHRGTVTWTKSGTDAADFGMVSATGVLSMIARDHENPADDDQDNVYEVTVTATDEDGVTGSAAITLTVTDVDEAPTPGEPPADPGEPPTAANRPPEFQDPAPLAVLVDEGTTGVIGPPVVAIDPDGDELTYSLSGSDAAFFAIDPPTGQLSIPAATPLTRNVQEAYGFVVLASDGDLTASRKVTVVVLDAGSPADPPPTDVPAAPTNVAATLLTSTVALLSWEDNSANEAGFVIFIRANGEEWTALRSVAADVTTATIEGLQAGSTYEFLVAAANPAGSAASGTAAVTLSLAPPTHVDAALLEPTIVRVTWRDNSTAEEGFEVEYRLASNGHRGATAFGGRDAIGDWTVGAAVGANRSSAIVSGLEAGRRYVFRVKALAATGSSFSLPGTVEITEPPPRGSMTDCTPAGPVARLSHDYDLRMCFETPSGVQMDASNYHLESAASGLAYFFDRDNVEVLAKVLDGCAINGHRWAFVAPVTDLAFNLEIVERSTGRRFTHRNPKGTTAMPRSDTAAFPCEPGAGEAAGAVSAAATWATATDLAALPTAAPAPGSADTPACEPDGPGVELAGGYRVDMCVVLPNGEERPVLDWGLGGPSSALLYFFDRENVEVLVKVLDGCAINGHRWVFAAPATDLAFHLAINGPGGKQWTHLNPDGRTALPRADTRAFACE